MQDTHDDGRYICAWCLEEHLGEPFITMKYAGKVYKFSCVRCASEWLRRELKRVG